MCGRSRLGWWLPEEFETMDESTRSPEEAVREYARLWNDQDYTSIPDVVSGSFRHVGPVAEVEGPDGLEGLMREFTGAFPDFRVEILDLVVDGETVAAEVRYTMTHEGEFNGIAPTHREVEVGAMGKLLVEAGKIREHHDYHNQMAILEQLGVSPE